MKNKTDLVIFTDLDGTLLDHITYSFDAAIPALNLVKENHIPLILCSSKTRAEIEVWRERLHNKDPFICENGGGIFLSEAPNLLKINYEEKDSYTVIELGIPYPDIIKQYKILKDDLNDKIRGFSEMDVDYLVKITGLPLREAILAKKREYTEPFTFHGDKKDEAALEKRVKELNLNLTRGGRFFCLMGGNDKGKAVHIVSDIYRENCPGLHTIGIGDSYNDLPMLQAVDLPVLVRKPGEIYDRRINLPNLHHAQGVGPAGWNEAVSLIISKL